MTETLTAPAPAAAAGPADPDSNVLRIPEGIEVLPSTPPETRDVRMVLIIGTRPPIIARHEELLKNRVMALRQSSAYPETFMVTRENYPHVADFVYGALMNPTPVEGAFYMHPVASDLVPSDSGLHYVSQYMDGEWRIVLPVSPGNTVRWSSRHTGDTTPRAPYYRVKAPLALIPEGWAYTPDDVTEVTDRSTQMVRKGAEDTAAATTAVRHGVISLTVTEAEEPNPVPEHLRAHAADGAMLNETPQPGVLYALSLYGNTTDPVEFAYPAGANDWYVSHDISRAGGDSEPRVNGRSMHRTVVTGTSSSQWVRARTVTVDSLPRPYGVDTATRLASLRSEAAMLISRWESYEESLNEVADEHSWCPDFERILEPLGMAGRTEKKQRTGTVDVTLTWEGEWEHSGISSSQDELIGEALNFEHPGAVSITRAALTLSGRITIRRTGIPLDSDGDAVWDDSDDLGIGSENVATAVTRLAGGTLEVEEFSVDTVRFVGFDD